MTIQLAPMSQNLTTPQVARGASLVSVEGLTLPLRETKIEASAQGGMARVRLSQTFVNPGKEPLRVSYLLPLPAKAAVSGFSFELDGAVTRGVVKTREDARTQFEEALLEGRSAAILDEESATLFRQEVGNVPAGAEIVVSMEVDQKLSWLGASGAWEWRFPTVVAPRYHGSTVPDAEVRKVHAHVADLAEGEHLSPRAQLELNVLDDGARDLSSASHALRSHDLGAALTRVMFQGDGDGSPAGVPLDRDIVVRWTVAQPQPGVSVSVDAAVVGGTEGAFALVTVVPPMEPQRTIARDLIVLLDTSGSMSGEPLAQAVEVVSALVDTLGPNDRLEMLEFSSSVHRWKRGAVAATPRKRASALRWLQSLKASGCTDMHGAIRESLAVLGAESQRQVIIVSDGLIGGERQLVDDIARNLPAACRVHTLGIGHGVNRTLTAGAARAGRGIEQIVAPGEDTSAAIAELRASTDRPVLVDLKVSGSAALESACPAFDVYAGTPSLIPVRFHSNRKEAAETTITVEGRTAEGFWSRTIELATAQEGSGANAVLFARERVDQIEAVESVHRPAADIDEDLERLGLDFQIATRRTSWVAVSSEATVDPTQATRRVEMPHELAAGLSAEGLGLRSPMMDLELAAPLPVGSPPPPAAAPEARAASTSHPSILGGLGSERRRLKKTKKEDMLNRIEKASFEDAEELDDALESLDAPQALELDAQIVLDSEGRLVITWTIPHDIEWKNLGPIHLELEDGSRTLVSFDPSASTSGSVQAGTTLRLALLDVPGDTALARRFVVIDHPLSLRLRLPA